jgi:hypothetical protein
MTNELREQLQKEVEKVKEDMCCASKDAVPFYKKHKKAVLISGAVLVILIIVIAIII